MLRQAARTYFFVISLPLVAMAFRIPAAAQETGPEPAPFHLQDPSLFLGKVGDSATPLVLPRGLTHFTISVQRKTSPKRRDSKGAEFPATEARSPDYRYVVLNMGFGLGANLEANFTLPYVMANGLLESPASFYPRSNLGGQFFWRCTQCSGLTDSWASLKWQPVRSVRLPLVVQGDFKFPELYRHSNPYLGTRAHDFRLSAYTVVHNQRAWLSPKLGYLWRGGAFATSLIYVAEAGVRPFASERAHGLYLRFRLDGNVAHHTGQVTDAHDRYKSSYELAPEHFFTYNDWEGHRATWGAGAMWMEWNWELSYARPLRCSNCVVFNEWSLTASRPLIRRERIDGDRIVAAPTEQEARVLRENSIVLGPGEGYAATIFDWHIGGHSHDNEGRHFRAASDPQQDYRYLSQTLWYGLPKGFEASVMLPYLWAKTFTGVTGAKTNGWGGLMDPWVTVRKQFLYNRYVPLGVSAEIKLPEPSRHSDRLASEIKHDILVSLFTVKSGRNWWVAPKFGYKWREGAMSDELPYVLDTGYRPGFSRSLRDVYFKVLLDGNFSRNNSTPRTAGDKFGDLALAAPPDHYFTLNEGAVHRMGYGFGLRTIRNWNFEIVKHEYTAWKNNYVFRQDWTFGFSRGF